MHVALLQTRHRMLPKARTITLMPYTNGTASSAVTVNNVRRRPWSKYDLQWTPVALETERTTFLLPLENCGSTVPKQGDLILDDEAYNWIIVGMVNRELEGAVFRCPCCKAIGVP